ncbi:hypothetical protein [Vibrio barjaei]|uniref:hypothetical protein n=1 Tax=Vibrio barjaei TaxID=1676683 RepID=UPI002284EF7E|nr:hypothetical protein [Vibrio barjaei]MCY9874055.1 hypothetical protein [Vibrio barjaei]
MKLVTVEPKRLTISFDELVERHLNEPKHQLLIAKFDIKSLYEYHCQSTGEPLIEFFNIGSINNPSAKPEPEGLKAFIPMQFASICEGLIQQKVSYEDLVLITRDGYALKALLTSLDKHIFEDFNRGQLTALFERYQKTKRKKPSLSLVN